MTTKRRPKRNVTQVLELAAEFYLRAAREKMAIECLIVSVGDPYAVHRRIPQDHHDNIEYGDGEGPDDVSDDPFQGWAP
jgi:hypothetical protein